MILVANDQEWFARSLESILAPNGYAVLRAYTGQQALDLARSALPDAVILDWKMPALDGVDVCRLLRADPYFSPTTPILLTTSGVSGRTQRLEAYRAGAWEFCSQPLDGELLLAKLQTFMASKQEANRAREESLLDPVSGLYSMRGLARRAREIGAEAFRACSALACIAFSPEAAGDGEERVMADALPGVAEYMGKVCRRAGRLSDAMGRLGQVEFAIVAPRTSAKGAGRLIDRLREQVAFDAITQQGFARPMSLRAGYCAVDNFADSPVDAVELLLRATTALRHVRTDTAALTRSFEDIPNAVAR